MKARIMGGFIALLILSILLFSFFQNLSKATSVKANLMINTKNTTGNIPPRWIALAQGGEEKGIRMLGNVTTEVAALNPRFIRLDHIYDYYDVISRNSDGSLFFNWDKLDETVCDIYQTGAKPFFSLGYMPEVLSGDTTLISVPQNWNEWALTVQKTIEHYSGQTTQLCGNIMGEYLNDIYYEVWNEPDLGTFGKWSLYGGSKDYKTLYYYSVLGANRAQNVNHFLIGGPVPTALYKNWVQVFLDYISQQNIRLDFISWHHYSKNIDDFTDDAANLNSWLNPPEYQKYQSIPRIISEWGYDSNPNPLADTNAGAAHTIASLRNFIRYNFEMGFLFEVKDGPSPRWGILGYSGEKKPRYNALKLLTLLEGKWINVEGEGTFIRALASSSPEKTTVIIVNYDPDNKNVEQVPVTLTDIENANYTLTLTYLDGNTTTIPNLMATNNQIERSILLPPNMIVALELKKE